MTFTKTLFGAAMISTVLASCQTNEAPSNRVDTQNMRAVTALANCQASQCKTLDLEGGRLLDFAPLSTMSHVDVMMLSYSNFTRLDVVAGHTHLKELHIGATNVTDLRALKNLPNLTVLHAQDLDRVDYAPIAALTQLEELVVGKSDVADIGFVRSLPRLKRLSIEYSEVKDLSPLIGHPSLQVLDAISIEAQDFTPLLSIPTLKKVSVGGTESLTEAQQDVVERLKAKGVEVEELELVIVC